MHLKDDGELFERSLLGSLTDNKKFKSHGMMKKVKYRRRHFPF